MRRYLKSRLTGFPNHNAGNLLRSHHHMPSLMTTTIVESEPLSWPPQLGGCKAAVYTVDAGFMFPAESGFEVSISLSSAKASLTELHSLLVKEHNHSFSPDSEQQNTFASSYKGSFKFSPFDFEETALAEKLAEEKLRKLKRKAYKESKILRAPTMSPVISSHSSNSSITYIRSPAPPVTEASFTIDAVKTSKQHTAFGSIDPQRFNPISSMVGSYHPGSAPTIGVANTVTVSRPEELRRISRHSLLVKCAQPPAMKKMRRVIDELEAQIAGGGCPSIRPTPRNPLNCSKL
jgi:hypothetical protein